VGRRHTLLRVGVEQMRLFGLWQEVHPLFLRRRRISPTRDLLFRWLPHPPQVEMSSLGDAAGLTGALAVGLRAALDNSFQNRARA
jgi:hypothetical protein